MNALVFALALCAQAPPPQQVTLADGNVYQITYQRVSSEGVPPPPAAGAPRSPSPQSPSLAMAAPQPPAKQQPLAMAAPVQVATTPQATVQYAYTQPAATQLLVQPVALSLSQPMASVSVVQPHCLKRAVSRVGLALYQVGVPQLRVVPAPVTLQLQQSTVAVQPVQTFRAALASQQQ